MNIPKQYKNLSADEKRTVVLNLINECWYEKTPEIVSELTNAQIDFLFNYIFSESREEREKMCDDMQKNYETAIRDLRVIAENLRNLDLQFAELLAQREDTEEFKRNIR